MASKFRRHFIRLACRIRLAMGLKAEIPRIASYSTDGFTELAAHPPLNSFVKLIAYYLPQFHPFPENDAWWGKGFTEWSNVGKAMPNFKGHYQPHCPIHLGYYDLRLVENMIEQARLAKSYGIYGFCYYFYWFDGKVLMHRPLEQMLGDNRVDMPFCLVWANENWSRRWDGRENDILIAQNHSTEDSLAFIRYLEPYFKDDRYIKIDGKPVLAVYRADLIPNIEETGDLWREQVKQMGFVGLYLVAAQSFDIDSPTPYGFDAAVQFPPHPIKYPEHKDEIEISNPSFDGRVFDYREAASRFVTLKEPTYKLMRASMLSWDNTARKQDASLTFNGFSLDVYKQWLSHDLNSTAHDPRLSNGEKFAFINAWNEWAEGTHLEPDRRYGYGYLQATHDELKNYDMKSWLATSGDQHPVKQNDVAIIVHLHYSEVFDQLATQIERAFPDKNVDIYVTATSGEIAQLARSRFPNAFIRLVENRGRDVLPFSLIFRLIQSLGYTAICKIHSKRSLYRPDGKELLQGLIEPLLGSSIIAKRAIEQFEGNASLGMLVPEKFLLRVNRRNTSSNLHHLDYLERLSKVEYEYSDFAAGTMFWFKPEALLQILLLTPDQFELERGLADGTLPHAVERMMTSWVRANGYQVATA